MTREHRQEALSRAYVTAVAARAGVTHSVPSHAYGIDLILNDVRSVGAGGVSSGDALYVQLKSTTAAAVEPAAVVYDLDVRAYNLLSDWRNQSPAVLVVYVMPADETEWTIQDEARLELRSCAYWVRLRGRPPTANTTTVRVRIPRANQFTPAELRRIMGLIHTGRPLT